jgi:hypothetical protein
MVRCDSRLFERRKSWLRQISVTIISRARPSIDRASTGYPIGIDGPAIRPKWPVQAIGFDCRMVSVGVALYARDSIGTGVLETLPSIVRKGSPTAGLSAC